MYAHIYAAYISSPQRLLIDGLKGQRYGQRWVTGEVFLFPGGEGRMQYIKVDIGHLLGLRLNMREEGILYAFGCLSASSSI